MRSKRLKQKMEVPKGKPKEEKANSERRSEEDISKDEKAKLTVNDLLKLFEQATGEEVVNDRMLLV